MIGLTERSQLYIGDSLVGVRVGTHKTDAKELRLRLKEIIVYYADIFVIQKWKAKLRLQVYKP